MISFGAQSLVAQPITQRKLRNQAKGRIGNSFLPTLTLLFFLAKAMRIPFKVVCVFWGGGDGNEKTEYANLNMRMTKKYCLPFMNYLKLINHHRETFVQPTTQLDLISSLVIFTCVTSQSQFGLPPPLLLHTLAEVRKLPTCLKKLYSSLSC